MLRHVARLRAVAEEYLSPSLLNDYIRLTTVSIAMGLVIGLSTVVVHEFYHYSHLLFETLIHTSILFTFILPVVGITVAYVVVTRYATTKQSGGGSHRLLEVYHYEGAS